MPKRTAPATFVQAKQLVDFVARVCVVSVSLIFFVFRAATVTHCCVGLLFSIAAQNFLKQINSACKLSIAPGVCRILTPYVFFIGGNIALIANAIIYVRSELLVLFDGMRDNRSFAFLNHSFGSKAIEHV